MFTAAFVHILKIIKKGERYFRDITGLRHHPPPNYPCLPVHDIWKSNKHCACIIIHNTSHMLTNEAKFLKCI